MGIIEEAIGQAAAQVAKEINASCIISLENAQESPDESLSYMYVKVNVFKQVRKGIYSKFEYKTQLSKHDNSSILPIKELLMEGVSKSYIKKGDKIVCVADESVSAGYKGLLFIFDVDKIFFNISTHNLAENISPDVIETIIDIALEINREGREGRKIGTAFIVGDKSNILRHMKQMIINPFAGYSEDMRKITDPLVRETIKEFAQLDGAFVIDQNGAIITAGSYINLDSSDISIPDGLGTRHRSCAAITKETGAIAVVVSQSGVVRVFKEGRIIMKLP